MSETGSQLLSKKERALHIGAAYKIDSPGLSGIACIPTTVAFTHGYSDEEFKWGLHAHAFTLEVLAGSKELAKKYGEQVVKKSFLVHSIDQVNGEIADILDRSRAVWVIYLEADGGGHIMGLLKEDRNKYLLWDTANLPRVNEVTSETLAEIIATRHKESNLFAYILGFSK